MGRRQTDLAERPVVEQPEAKVRFHIAAVVAAVFLLTSAAARVSADALDDGRALYKAGRYAEAASVLERATRERPNDARPWWHLNFAYNKLERYADAYRAVREAGRIDPTHRFASERGKYEETLARLARKAGPAAAGTGSATRPATAGQLQGSGGEVVRSLTRGDVYVAPGVRVDAARLQKAATDLRGRGAVKFALLGGGAASSRLETEADRIRTYLNLRDGFVVVASTRAVAASGGGLARDRIREVVRQAAPQMESGDWTGGLARLAHLLVEAREERARARQRTVGVVAGGAAALAGGLVALGAAARRRSLAARKQALEAVRADALAGVNYLDNSLPLVDGAAAAAVREARASAGTRLDEASRLMAGARRTGDLERADALLGEAARAVAAGRGAIDRATGAVPAGEPPPATAQAEAGPDWAAVPDTEKGVCFFCSQPSRLSDLTPVTVSLDGRRQRVLACPHDLATVREGGLPMVRAFQQDGRTVPWYASQDYDPFRDYHARGYADRSLLTDLVLLSAIDSTLWGSRASGGWGHRAGGGANTAFYPEHDHYADYQGARAAEASDFSRADASNDEPSGTAGGVDFLSSSFGDDYSGSDQS